MNQKLQAVPPQGAAQAQQKDWSQAIASLAVSALDTKREVDAVKGNIQQIGQALMQVQQLFMQQVEEIKKKLPSDPVPDVNPPAPETPKAA